MIKVVHAKICDSKLTSTFGLGNEPADKFEHFFRLAQENACRIERLLFLS